MELTAAVLTFVVVLGLVASYGYRVYARSGRALAQLTSAPGGLRPSVALPQSVAAPPKFKVRTALQWLGQRLPMDPAESSMMRRILFSAGYREEYALAVFIGIRVISVLVFAGIAVFAMNFLALKPLFNLIVLILSLGLGYWIPGMIVEEFIVPSRREKLRFALPDALDMLVICVESGISLDQAIQTVSEELKLTHPELCRDLSLVSVEMRAGVPRAQALRNLSDRTLEPELGKLVAMLIQTDRFGTSIGSSLRAHADFMRIRRRQEAEERAGKLSVKLVFPVFFLILPAVIIAAAGPAMIGIYKGLMPALRGGG